MQKSSLKSIFTITVVCLVKMYVDYQSLHHWSYLFHIINHTFAFSVILSNISMLLVDGWQLVLNYTHLHWVVVEL